MMKAKNCRRALGLMVIAILPILSGCSPTLKEAYACDLHQSDGCALRPGTTYELRPATGLSDSLKSWTDFAHYLYFHSRVTPGIRVDIRWMSERERSRMSEAVCEWSLEDPKQRYHSVNGRMEGVRTDKNGLWCFDYLGTMLLAFARANGIASEKANPAAIFPLRLRLHARTGILSEDPSIDRPIDLRLPDGAQPDR